MKKPFQTIVFRIALFSGILSSAFAFVGTEAVGATKHTNGGGTPKLQFETNFVDLGKITGVETVSGRFKFKNAGDGTLKVDPPQPGCDCTSSTVKPDTLAPGETGEITYTIKLEQPLHHEQKYIRVHSNDPQTPDVELTMQLDYTPLYELTPSILGVTLPANRDKSQRTVTVTRTDGKDLDIDKLTTTEKWIDAAFVAPPTKQDSSAKINVTVHRPPGLLSSFNARVELWSPHQTNRPVKVLQVAGEIQGELIANPRQLYWVFPDLGKIKADYPPGVFTKTVELKSSLGNAVEIKSARSDIEGLNVTIIPRDAGKTFDMLLKFDELPRNFSKGKVTVETTLASLPTLEVPVTIAVP